MAILAPVNGRSDQWTTYTVATVCQRITLKEQTQGGTTDYYTADPSDTSKFNTVSQGAPFTYENIGGAFMFPGDTPFQYKTVSGSVSFDRKEE